MRDYKEMVETLRLEADGFLMDDVPDMLMVDTLNDAADAIEELCKQLASCSKPVASCSKWISVEDALPEEGERVLILYELRDDEENISIGWLANGGFDCWDDSLWTVRSVTHWMTLQEPPKEE